MRRGFSMIELIFVIIVLGIVASIGAGIISKAFEMHIVQKATDNAAIKTELAALQIANRLSHAIPWTLVAKNRADAFNDYERLSQLFTPGYTYTILEWVGVDNDSFSARSTPGWSGFCDISTSTPSQCSTPGSDLNTTNTIIGNLSSRDADITKSAIFFKNYDFNSTLAYHPECIGLVKHGANNNQNTSCAIGVNAFNGEIISFDSNTPKIRAEHYALSWSAYAIVPENFRDIDGDKKNDVWDLRLYYDYRPWESEKYTDGKSALLINNVSVFKFTSSANTIRFKLCIQQPIGEAYPVTLCKEKAVIR